MPRSLLRVTLVLGGIGVLLICAVVMFLVVGRTSSSLPLPSPNGYDEILKAAQSVTRRFDELVPKYLQHVPPDSFSSRALVYRPQEIKWSLYSIGPDRVDNGGKPAGRSDYLIGLETQQFRRSSSLKCDSQRMVCAAVGGRLHFWTFASRNEQKSGYHRKE